MINDNCVNNLGSGPKLGQGSGSKNTLRQDPPRPCRWGWWGTAWCWWPPSGQPGILASPEQSGQWMHRRSWSTCRLTLEILWRMAWPFSQTFLLVKMSKLCLFFFFNYQYFYPLDLAVAKWIDHPADSRLNPKLFPQELVADVHIYNQILITGTSLICGTPPTLSDL